MASISREVKHKISSHGSDASKIAPKLEAASPKPETYLEEKPLSLILLRP